MVAGTAPLAAQLMGSDGFVYADGAIAGQSGGSGFNRDHFDKAVGTGASDWDDVLGTPTVEANALVTENSGGKREYNGPVEGFGSGDNDGQDDHERSGAIRGAGRVFYRFTMSRAAGVTWSGASSYDFGTERAFFGVPGYHGSASGGLEFGCGGNGNTYFTGIPADNDPHTLVAVLDFDHNFIGMWLDPTAADYYDPVDGSHSADAGGSYTPDHWSTAVRLASSPGGPTRWDDLSVALDPVSVGLKNYTDADGDGLPASFEALCDLDDDDDGSTGESAAGAKDGPNGAMGDPDGDTFGNLAEFESGTLPNAGDSDLDLLSDDREKALGTDPLRPDSDGDGLDDREEAAIHATNPLLADSDGDGTADFTEVALGTHPLTPGDAPAKHGNMGVVGLEFFDTYTDGSIAGFSEGSGWDYDNSALRETFTGHTTLEAAWTNVTGSPVIQSGMLLTQNNAVRRAFHGGSSSPKAAVGEGSGSWREASAATGINGSGVLYVKVNLTRQAGASWSGVSLYDFGTERIFLGVPHATHPQSDRHEFGIEQASNRAPVFSGVSPTAGTPYTIVGRFDFAASRVDLRVNPDLSAPEQSSAIAATFEIDPTQMNATALRLGSGGTGATGWDQLVVATTWDGLRSLPGDSDGDGQSDGGEIEGQGGVASDPHDPGDTVGAPLGLIGTDGFDYPDGDVAGLAGGAHFDYENWLFNGPFVGHTATGSDWDGDATVAGGRLVTRDSQAIREFNGPSEGPGSDEAPTDARAGAVNGEAAFDANVVFFKATMTRHAGAALSELGPDDFGSEHLAFGIVEDGGAARWGIREGEAVDSDGGARAVVPERTYTVVGKLDFAGNLLSLWIDPDLDAKEAANNPGVTRVYSGSNWASGIRFASTGTGNTEWDDVVVATTWERLKWRR